MRLSSLLTLSLLFYALLGLGQSPKEKDILDSLISAIEHMPGDSHRVKAFASIANKLRRSNPQEALSYSKEGLSLAEKLNWKKGQLRHQILSGLSYQSLAEYAQALKNYEEAINLAIDLNELGQEASINNQIGQIYFEWADYDKALSFYQASLSHAEESRDSIKIAKRYNNIANVYFSRADYAKALECHEKALDIKRQLKDEGSISMSLENIGLVYLRQADYPKALDYFLKAVLIREKLGLKSQSVRSFIHIGIVYFNQNEYSRALENYEAAYRIADSLGDRKHMSISLSNMAEVYQIQKEYDKALEFSKEALALKREIGDSYGMASTLDNMGKVFRERSEYSQSLSYHLEALQIRDSISEKRGQSVSLNNIGLVYMDQRQHARALEYYKRSLLIAREVGILDMQSKALYNMTGVYKAMGNASAALSSYEEFVNLDDSIYGLENTKKIARIEEQAKYEQKRQADSAAFILEKIQMERDNQAKLNTRNYLLFGGLGLALISLIFFRYRQQLRNRENELKLQKEQVRKNQLEELDKLKSRFFANISHEFRTPLSLILGPVSDLYRKTSSPSEKEELSLIRNSAQKLLRLVNQILDLSKLESGKFELNLIHADLISFLGQIVASFQSLAQSKNIRLNFTKEVELLPIVFDPDMLEKVLLNLIGNAVKYTPAEGIITLSLEDKDDRIDIWISDTGFGIDPYHLPHIFDRFYQVNSREIQSQQASTGIGLALVKELIEIHGGEITVQSEVEVGTTFSFWIPKRKAVKGSENVREHKVVSEIDTEISEGVSPHYGSTAPLLKADDQLASILIVEDNSEVRNYLRKSLADSYNVLEAFDGTEGLEKAIKEIPDLIITDVMMPNKDGFSLTQDLKANKLTHHIPVIILTGKSSRESKLEALTKEAEEFLTKPFDSEELRLRIQSLLNNRKRLQEKFSRRLLLEASELEVSSQEEVFLKDAISLIEANLGNEAFSIEQMADELNLSRVQLFRKLKALTNLSPSRFIRSIRLKRAKQMIEGRVGTIAEIAYSVGFGSPTYFGKCFKEQYGSSPSDLLIKKDA